MNSENPSENDSNDGGTGSDHTPNHSPNFSGARKKKSKSKKGFGLRQQLGKLGNILKNPFHWKDKSKKLILDETFMHDNFNIFLNLDQLGKDGREASAATPQIRFDDSDTIKVYFICFKHPIFDKKGLNVLLNVFGLGAGRSRPIPMTETQLFINEETHKSCLIHELSISKKDLTDRDNKLLYQYQIVWYNPELQKEVVFNEQIYVAMEQRVESFYRLLEINQDHHLLENSMYFQIDDFVLLPSKVDMLRESYYQEYRKYQMENRKGLYLSLLKSNLYYISKTIPLKSLYEYSLFVRGVFEGAARSNVISHENRPVTWKTGIIVREEIRDMQIQLLKTYDIHKSILQGEESSFDERVGSFIFILSSLYSYLPLIEGLGCKQQILRYAFNGLSLETLYRGMSMKDYFDHDILNILKRQFPEQVLRKIGSMLAALLKKGLEQNHSDHIKDNWCSVLVLCHVISFQRELFIGDQTHKKFSKKEALQGIDKNEFTDYIIHLLLENLSSYSFSLRIDPAFQRAVLLLAGSHLENVVNSGLFSFTKIANHIQEFLNTEQLVPEDLQHLSLSIAQIPMKMIDDNIEGFVKLLKVVVDKLPVTQLTRDLYDAIITKLLTWTRSNGGENEAGDVDDEKKDEKSIPKETPVNEEKPTTPPSEEFSVQAEAGSEKPPINDEENPSNAAGLPQDGSKYINSTLEKALANIVVSLTENFDLRIWYDVDSWFVHSGLKFFNDLLNLVELWGLGSLIFEIVQKLEKSFKALRNNAHGDYKLVGLNTDNYRPEVTFMMEPFIADATLAFFKAFFVLDINNITKHSETDKNILYMQMSGRNCHVVVTSFLEEWVKLETLEQKTHYLLFWPSMAAFVEFTWNTNDAGQEVGPFRNVRYEILITLDELEKKLITFELPLLLLKSIKRKKEAFIAIFMMVKGGAGRTTIDQLERNLQRLKEFDEASDILKFFNDTMKKAGSRIIDTRPLEGLLAQASDGDLTFAELEIKAPGDAWKYYNVNSTDVIVNFFKLRLGDSKIFARSWELFLRDYTSIDSLAKVDPIVDLLLTPTLQNLKDFMMSLDQGKADVAMIDLYLNWPVTKALNEAGEETTETKSVNHFTPNQLQEELLVLYRYFGLKENVNHEKKDKFIRKLTTNCFCYLRVKSLAKAYKNVLQIKEALQLTGDFTNIETLDQMDLFDQNKPISEYSEELQKSLVEISNTEEKVFENVLNNINFFLWMRESMKGPQEVKTFVDLVTNSAGESDYEHDRILDFESVCQAFRPIIFNVRREASFGDLHIACNETSIHTNTDIFYKLSDCKRNLEWFKHMKRIQGSASTKTFEQIKAINKKGEYTIGIAQPDYEMFLTEDIDMKKVVRLQFTSKKTGTRDLLLTEIEDLQSSLMLLGREARGGAENHDEAETEKTIFVQHTELAIQLGTLYVDLCQMGDVASFNWNISFPCNIYSTTEGDPEKKSRQLYEIYAEIKKMEERRNKLNSLLEVHTNYPALNYFTNKQCLLLQKYFYQRDGNLLLNVIGLLRLTPGRKNMTMKTARQFIDFILKNSATIDDEKSIVDVGTAPFQSLSFVGRVLNVNKVNNAYSIPSYINCNKPTLVSLPKDEVLQFVLGMYFEYNGELPNQENILVCTKETTLEQVKLLMLRVGYNKDGLYCLVFADSMNYIACEKAVDFMNQIMRNGREMGKFVFVCCTENESKSNLVASLDTYRTRKSLEYTETEQRLRDKLCMRTIYKTHSGLNFASKADVEDFNTRIITSSEGGMGKSLYVDERKEIMLSSCYGFTSSEKASKNILTIRVQGTTVDVVEIVERLQEINSQQMDDHPKFYHFDVAPTVTEGVDALFFNVVILGMLQTPLGKVWHKNQQDYVIIEMTTTHTNSVSNFMAMLPQTRCATPQETINFYKNDEVISPTKYCQLNLLSLEPFRRVHTYLEAYVAGEEILNQLAYFVASEEALTILQKVAMLEMFVRKCGVLNPTWMEIRNFVYFFNMQLMDSENCIYTSVECSEMFPGFKNFVLKFLLRMAKDFSTRSLGDDDTNKLESGGFLLELKTKWEQSHHPYLFFNKDGGTFTFFGLNINQAGDLVHKRPNGSNEIVEPQLMNSKLHGILSENMKFDIVNFASDYQKLPREKKLTILYRVLIGGSDFNFDPDPNYQLTVDNMKKMLAIFTRIKCSIPVILMGETGCGKTSLITFMCKILAKSKEASNLVLVKIHGGVTKQHIMQHVQNAKKLAKKSGDKKTILFFDEANTTDAIGLIKEIIIDKSLNGELLGLEENNMVVIAACNPYRRHSQDMIERLESAGLGYHVGTDQTYEKIGQIPLRQLVYRVHPLPESMKPLVWDFGQLDDVTEELYTREIVNSAFKEKKLPQNDTDFIENLISLLTASQKYMRSRKNECSFVSLRDVERSVQVASWFYKVYTGYQLQNCPKDILKQILILTIAVCYIARLEKRHEFLKYIAPFFKGRFHFDGGTLKLKELIKDYQREFVDDLQVKENIAKNEALCENIFMMVVCIELRIPLFIVGKPGSSKSLAKTIIQDNMQGSSSASPLFRKFKEIFVTSYQCSPHSTADGIISVFRQAQNYQQDRNLDLFASVVVLDEVGLAEDSPKMPLKALHPLLEDGTDGFEDLRDAEKEEARYRKTTGAEKRVAFIGISNWALDPAKMNRGIMLKRNMLDLTELISTASEICSSNERIRDKIKFLLKPLSEAFYKLYNMQKENPTLIKHRKEEFFGMRDFYSLIKMIFCAAKFYNGMPPLHEIELAVLRNFSGLEQYDMWAIFRDVLTSSPLANALGTIELEISAADMIRKNFEKNCLCCSLTPTVKRCQTNRYLLIMTEKYSSLPIIKGMELDVPENLSVIFGSSFPKDQEFTQVCRDINKIKICMETGRTVILLNMENLYESLYDALNQYYVEFGGKNYVDLGLGTHRVRCRVHEDFKLIVVADKKVVYELFPIPLINRLEKHFLTMTSSLEPYQLRHAKELMEWAKQVASNSKSKSTEEGMFVGYNSDTCGAIIMQLCQKGVQEDQLFERGQDALIKIATPDGILRSKNKHMIQTYFNNQKHDSLKLYLQDQLSSQNPSKYLQVTTHSRLLSLNECQTIAGEDSSVTMFSLVQFETDHSFRHSIKSFLETKKSDEQKNFLFIQYNMTATSGNLITCAQHITEELCLQHTLQDNTFIVFILQITRRFDSTLSGLSCSQAHWDYIHIDDLREPDIHMPSFMKYLDRPMSDLFAPDCQEDLSMLIKGSVPSAMKTLNTMGETRIDELAAKLRVVNHLFDKNKVFSSTVISEIHKQLLHKESQVLPEHSKGWVMREAVEQHYIPNYGTFRASLALCVEDKVIPVWKSLLTLMDENSNLMVLHQGMDLYGGLWTLLFQAFTTSGEHNEKPIEESKQSNYSRFPFSKRISLMLDNVMQTYVIGASEEDKRENLSKAMNGLSINSLLSNLSNEQIEDYKKDFLMYKFPGLAQQGYQILNDNMSWSAAQQSDGEPQAAHSRIGDIHVAHQDFERSCLAKIFSFKPDLLLRSLFFDKSILKNIDRTVLKFLLNHYNKLFEETDVHSIQKINSELQKLNKFLKDVFVLLDIDVFPNIKLMWEKLQIVQIFIQHVINENGALDTILIFWNSLESDLHMCISEEGGWLTIETIFTETIRSTYNPSFRQACCQCLISLLDEFIVKKCGQSPHMVETALRYIFHASVDIPSSQISPVEGFAIHSTPMLKMYLLQSLIQRNIDVEEYLERFLEERLLLLENLNVIEICKMFMFTYQVKFYLTEI
ncbi:E3 ubiquitin-protein ligase rnf213-alpha-like [Clytia hemisphaerica]|uniref:E3 ubiquitin-protein ligase rnf213-alpha-like n=1 Tax=Clytia hemisphaerica TaxID=252671 RepID=UPI0034D4B1A6